MYRSFLLLLICIFTIHANAQLLTFDFAGITGNEANVNSNFNAASIQSSAIARGPGINATANADRFNSNGWTTAASPDPDDYLEFTVTPIAGSNINFTGITILHQRSSTGPVNFVVRTSLDAFAADATNIIVVSDIATTQSSDFIFNTAVNTSSPVSIRVYAFSAEGATGSWGPGDGAGDDIIVTGVDEEPGIIIEPGEIVINQFSPDYGAASDEYVELLNTTGKTFDLSGLALRYQSAGGTNGVAGGALSGNLGPHQFWLLSPNAIITVGNTTSLPRDGAITAGFTAGSAQIALVRASDNTIIDALGYGTLTGGSFFETSPAPSPPADGGLKRVSDGADTDDNSQDFTTIANGIIHLRNSANNLLNVKFADLKAINSNGVITIQWANLTELNVLAYEVERSGDGVSFTRLASITELVNSGERTEYTFVDTSPLQGNNFYRIRSVEAGGTFTWSAIMRIALNVGYTGISIYPNPALRSGFVCQLNDLKKGKYFLRVVDGTGATVYERKLDHHGGSISEFVMVDGLKPGMYVMQIGNVSMAATSKFIVQ